ncbi:MAG TPA: BamA/TamA family outer membrane protein [Vicinamibacterales bacterium]
MSPRERRAPFAVLAVLVVCAAAACKEEGEIRVASLDFEGVVQADESQLRRALATREGSWIPFTRDPAFNREAFAADLTRLHAFYQARGYPDARVKAVDIELDEKGERASIVVTIDEGEPVRISAVTFQGFDGLPARRQQRLPRIVGLSQGSVRDRSAINAARDAALNELKEYGFPWARVDIEETAGESPRSVRLLVRADPGPRATFGDVSVRGNASVGDHVILRQLTFRPGDLYRQSRVRESQRRFSTMGLFDFAYVEPRGEEERPARVPVRITIAEAEHRRFLAAAGYGSEDKARARARWEHVNFFGGARTAAVEGKWSSLDRGGRVEFAEPYFFARQLSFSARAQAWNEAERVYSRSSYGGRATVRWQRDRHDPVRRVGGITAVSLSFINELDDYELTEEALNDPTLRNQLIGLGLDPETGSGRGTLAALRLEVERRTVANPLDARRGYAVTAALERAGGFLPGDFTYTEASAEGRIYVPLGRRLVLAQRLRGAAIDAPDSAAVPFFKRYFLGGSSSLRGWGRFDVSPLTGAGLPVGGLTLAELSTELRIPLTGKLSAVAFLDAGNVWREPFRFGPEGLRANVGPGLRYDTPVGPVRVDLGYQLTPIDGLLVDGAPERRHWRVHISIGQAF